MCFLLHLFLKNHFNLLLMKAGWNDRAKFWLCVLRQEPYTASWCMAESHPALPVWRIHRPRTSPAVERRGGALAARTSGRPRVVGPRGLSTQGEICDDVAGALWFHRPSNGYSIGMASKVVESDLKWLNREQIWLLTAQECSMCCKSSCPTMPSRIGIDSGLLPGSNTAAWLCFQACTDVLACGFVPGDTGPGQNERGQCHPHVSHVP